MGHPSDSTDRQPTSRALSNRQIVIAGFVVLLVTAAAAAVLIWLFGRETNKAQLDALRTALSIGAGTGGAAALVLAARRQRSIELALAHQQQVADDTRHDATQRRITDLYTKAADQLGSDKAPVRLAGLYALERVAQDNPEQRQTIVNLICAYLRMPYIPPAEPTHIPDTTTEGTTTSPAKKAEQRRKYAQQEQEKQVRLTAQRVLATHIRPETDNRGHPTNPKYWPGIDLDLTNATLLDFNLSQCHFHRADFARAQFNGSVRFDEAQFNENARFDGAQFNGDAGFDEAWFNGYTEFDGAQFNGSVRFDKAQFNGYTDFDKAQFNGNSKFDKAHFNGKTKFGEAQFNGYAGFDGAWFSRDTLFEKAQFARGADLDDARARVDVNETVQRSWPDGWVVQPPAKPEDGQLPEQEGTWGFLVRAATQARQTQ